MESSSEKLNREIREHISRLSTEALCGMVHTGRGKYTGFALEAAKQELATRRSVAVEYDPSTGLELVSSAKHRAPAQKDPGGCYVEVWRDKNFQGDHALIEGPIELRTLKSSVGSWEDCISSLRVGPRAFVLAYEKCNFSGQMVTFGPNEEVPDLSDYRIDDEIESVRLIDSLKIFDHGGFETGPANIHPSAVAGLENPLERLQQAAVPDARRKMKKARKHR